MNKKKLFGLVYCIQATLFEVFALYVLIPYFARINYATSHKYSDAFYFMIDNNYDMFIFIFWLIIFIAAAVIEVIGICMINSGCKEDQPKATIPQPEVSEPYSTSLPNYWTCKKCGASMTNYDRFCQTCGTSRPSEKVSPNEWICPICGRVNQNYVGSCGCGAKKP